MGAGQMLMCTGTLPLRPVIGVMTRRRKKHLYSVELEFSMIHEKKILSCFYFFSMLVFLAIEEQTLWNL